MMSDAPKKLKSRKRERNSQKMERRDTRREKVIRLGHRKRLHHQHFVRICVLAAIFHQVCVSFLLLLLKLICFLSLLNAICVLKLNQHKFHNEAYMLRGEANKMFALSIAIGSSAADMMRSGPRTWLQAVYEQAGRHAGNVYLTISSISKN